MRLLLDTHSLLWMLADVEKLSHTARSAIRDPENVLLASIASYWEIGIKVSIGKLTLREDWQESIPREMARNRVEWLPISVAHVNEVSSLPWHHRAPFDRLLLAQARVDGLHLVSGDGQFDAYGVSLVW